MELMSIFRQKTILIAAISPEGILAIDGHMPWHQPEDLKRFQKLTKNNVIVYGRKTHDSFVELGCSPLPGRVNYIVSRTLTNIDNNFTAVFTSIEEALSTARLVHSEKDIYICGGATIYEQTLPIVDKIELTIINKDQVCYHEGERTIFPNWEKNILSKDFEIERLSRSNTCQYVTYKRRPITAVNKIRSLFL